MGTTIQYASWNRISNEAGFADGSGLTTPAAAATLSPSDPAVSPAPTSPLNYFVRFIGADGNAITVNGGQFFALNGFSFSDTQTLSVGSASGGAGAGKVTLNPLQLSFSQPGLQPELFTMLAEGSHFKEVDIVGY